MARMATGGVVSQRIWRTLVSLAGVAPGRQPGDAVRIRLTVLTAALGITEFKKSGFALLTSSLLRVRKAVDIGVVELG